MPIYHPSGSKVSYQDWSSPISMNATMAWISKHMAPDLLPGDLDKYNLGRDQEWDAPPNPHQDGPNLSVTVTAKGKGAVVEIATWTMPLGHKSAKETITAATSATAHVTNDNNSWIKPFSLTLTAAQAQRFADEINALAVEHPVTWTGLAGWPDVTLTFQTAQGPRSFTAIRNDFEVQSLQGGPNLILSAALTHELNADIPNGQSSRPPTDKHPQLPAHIRSATLSATGQADVTVTGTRLTRLIADLRPLAEDPQAGTCTHKGRPDVGLTVSGDSDAGFTYFGNCDEVSPNGGLDGQEIVPFSATPAFEADVAALLKAG